MSKPVARRRKPAQMVRLNIGSGAWPLETWVNVEQDSNLPAELHAIVPPIPYADETVDEIYAGHFLEHLKHPIAAEFLRECYRVLRPGGRVGIVVPDTRTIMAEYLKQSRIAVEWPYGQLRAVADLDEVCGLFLYSTLQDSPHRWSYDENTLSRALELAGFEVKSRIDRMN